VSNDLVHVGFGDYVSSAKVQAVVRPGSSPLRRLVADRKAKGLIIDCTHGRATKGAIVLEGGTVMLVSLSPETIARRFADTDGEGDA
jgi:regulator of extracellular matrix RemA (YlzA/DUF370 family)